MRRDRRGVTLATVLALLALLLGPLAPFGGGLLLLLLACLVCAALAYLVWNVHPAYLLSGAFALSVLSGNWEHVGLPGTFALDRLLFVAGIATVVLRAPPVRDAPRITLRAVHWAMLVTLLWFFGSALASGTLEDRGELFELFERLGVVPFLLFLVAPVAFAEARHRRVLLGTLVGLGGYLGFTALMETLAVTELVFPSFINDGSIGTHADRARGPFLEAVTNGAGLFVGGTAAAIALGMWRDPRLRGAAWCVLGLCLAGLLFTETRSVWLGGGAAILVALLSVGELRRRSVPVLAAGAVLLALSVALVPGMAEQITERRDDQRTVWDRKNLAIAAVNMVEEEPLIGIGWGRFTEESADYFRLSMDYPQTAQHEIIHHVFLTYAAEAGLIGLGLWAVVLCLGLFAALTPSRRREARLWQTGLWAYLIFFLVVSNFVFAQVFPNNALWLLAGVAIAAAGGWDRRGDLAASNGHPPDERRPAPLPARA